MKEIKQRLKNGGRILFYSLLAAPIYAYLTFYFVYPIICPLPVGVYLYTGYLYIIYSLVIGMILGIFMESAQDGFLAVILASIIGYILSVFYFTMPSYLYGYGIYSSDIMVFTYIQYSFLLLFFYILFGLIGLLFGGYFRDKLE